MICANTSFPAYIICSRDGPHRRVATLVFTVQVGDRGNHGKLFAVHSFTRAYLENVGTLLTRPNNPLRKVTVNRFMIGKYEVTFEEYDRYVELTGGRSPNDETLGRQRRPVTDVMWEDAVGYAKWLSQATGKRYRLPTESEWEYAAGSGGKDTEWAGTSDENQLKDYAVYIEKLVKPVGSKKPNGLGLYDMSGNVWELVQDCYSRIGEECNFRVSRGGSCVNKPELLRVSYRFLFNVDIRTDVTGFRLAQDIP